MAFHRLLAEWSHWFWPLFADHLWQATLFTFVVWVAAKGFDRAPARYRYFLWLTALTKFVVPSATLIRLLGRAGVDLRAPFEAVRAAASMIYSGTASGMSAAY